MARAGAIWIVGPRVSAGLKVRAVCALVALACTAVLSLARHVKPDPRGFGTHEQLGLPPCGMLLTTGLPCPTCGMTSSFAHMMRGHLLSAVAVQPAGAVICLATMAALAMSVYILLTGRRPVVRWERMNPVRVMVGIGLLFVGSWGFKIACGLLTGTLPAH